MNEFDFGYDFAADCVDGPVDINEIVTSSVDIPPDDYHAMRRAGIFNPDARRYWAGYNSFFD